MGDQRASLIAEALPALHIRDEDVAEQCRARDELKQLNKQFTSQRKQTMDELRLSITKQYISATSDGTNSLSIYVG